MAEMKKRLVLLMWVSWILPARLSDTEVKKWFEPAFTRMRKPVRSPTFNHSLPARNVRWSSLRRPAHFTLFSVPCAKRHRSAISPPQPRSQAQSLITCGSIQ